MNPKQTAFFVPIGLKTFKQKLFEQVGANIVALGGRIVRHGPKALLDLPPDIVPIVGCSVELSDIVRGWRETKREFIYWDRSYCRRIFATWLPRAESGTGFYRWHRNAFQMRSIRSVPDDRWKALRTPVADWQKNGRHILIAAPTFNYSAFHRTERWTDEIVDALARATDRPLMIRGKESKRPLAEDLKGCHAIVAHASNAAVEAVIMGCPAFVHRDSAAALLGNTDVAKIEAPVYADREPWLNSLAYSQYNERELVDGTLWKLIE